MYGVELYAAVQLAVVDEGLSHHEAGRRFGIDRRTVKKMLSYSAPPGYRRTKPVRRPKLDGFTGIVDAILEADTDPDVPRKQRHTAHRIFERLRDEHGFTGGYTIVKDYVRARRQSTRETFVPLHHPPGHAQVDFGEAVVEVGGRREKVAFFCLILPHSNVWFVKAYPRETMEAFLDGHVSAFAFLGGLPRSILYDNTTLAVARILGDGTRRRTQAFTHLQSHYLFRDRFGRPGKGNDKGKVEALVKTARRWFMVPIPKVHDLSVLNERLLARCLEWLDALEAGGQAAALLADLDALRDLPAVPFEACEHVPGQISSTALVRYRLVDYSAPAAHAHKKVMVKGYVDRVEIALGAEIVARHRRSYVRGDVVYNPLHYLSLLEKKPGALDQAAPLRGWKLDPAFDTLRRLLEARFGPRGKREYIQVLRLHEDFPEPQVAFSAHIPDRKQDLLAIPAHPYSRENRDVGGLAVQSGLDHSAVKDQPNDILIREATAAPGVPIDLQARIEDHVTGSRVRCIGSNPRRAHGLAPVLVLADEPAQWPQPQSRFVALGTRPADSQHWFGKMLNGGGDYAQCHAARPDDPKFQRRTWAKANPSLAVMPDLLAAIKREAEHARRDPSLLASFEALRLNAATSDVEVSVLLAASTWMGIEGEAGRAGACTWGVELGTNAAQSAVAAFWPETGRLEVLAAFPSEPSFAERGLRDGVGRLYDECARRGELISCGGAAVDVAALLREALQRFGRPAALASDRWRAAELCDALKSAAIPMAALNLRGQGYKDGAEDVRAFRRAAAEGRVTPVKSLLLTAAMGEARVLTDPAGNSKLAKGSEGGRRMRAKDDAAAAAILAVALGVRRGTIRTSGGAYLGVA